MTSLSRNYVMNRRGSGIANLAEVSLTNGDIDLDQAVIAGVYKVNCSHQVGIATSQEVGLSSDRFPIRVVYINDKDTPPAQETNVVAGYWKVGNAAGSPVRYSRKAIDSELCLKNLWAMEPALNDRLFINYYGLANKNIKTGLHAGMTELSDRLYEIISLIAPNADQQADALSLISRIIDLSAEEAVIPYFKITENLFLYGEPHGRAYARAGKISKQKIAVWESAVSLRINYDRLKARYENLSDGAVSLAAYSITAMFRHGLFESYEHREYYTVYVTSAEGSQDSFKVVDINAPRGAAALTGLEVGSTVSIAGIKIKLAMVELANLTVVTSGLMHYLFNHTTGGTVVSGTLLTVLAMYQIVSPHMPYDEQVTLTSLFYEALHPSNKRAIANIFFGKSCVYTHGRCASAPRFEHLRLDSFAQIRSNPYPAGSHKAFMCMQALSRVIQSGLAPFLPWAEELNTCINMCKNVLTSGARAHIGSAYYTGETSRVQPAMIDKYLPELAQYLHIFNKGDSLTMSPHLSDDVARRAAMNWQNLLKDLKAKDISSTSSDLVREFLATSGKVHFTFDPEDNTTWARAVHDASAAQTAIDAIFA